MIALTLGAVSIAASLLTVQNVPLYTDLGNHSRPTSIKSPQAQQYFDQGLRLLYAFNHGEAIRSFKEAARIAPDCAICYWGAAYAYGPHVNAGMDSAAGVEAYGLAHKAMSLSRRALPVEAALIMALTQRYEEVPRADRARLDSAYATAMRQVAVKFPNDQDVLTLHAEALMDLRPWNYWERATGKPYPNTTLIVSQLERVLKENPKHPGACHYYIHAVEAVSPQKAVPCAERLASLMPGAGHLVHMPAHIYIRVGRYEDAIKANEHAVHADEVYIEGQKPQGIYPVGYYPHNYHFLALAATMAGRSAQAIEAANKTSATTPVELAKQVPVVEPYLHYPFLTLVTFGRWDDILAREVPPADLAYSYAMATYARGVAFAAKGQFDQARAALETVRATAGSGITPYAAAGWTTPSTNLAIAQHALAGEIAARENKLDDAITHFTAAMKIEDEQLYTEPPDWYYPIRHSLGAVLLKAGKPAEAEQLYRDDLKRFPENGWALFGLSQALKAQQKTGEATAVDQRFAKAWASADVKLEASRF